jgi:hypothetical protein
MPDLVNWDLLRNPYNWIVVVLMLAIGAFALCLLIGPNSGNPYVTPLQVV